MQLCRRTCRALSCLLVAGGCQSAPSASPAQVAEVSRAWTTYVAGLKGRLYSGACTPSPDWLAAEQARWPCYNLAFLYLSDDVRVEGVDIQPVASPGNMRYRVRTLFHGDSATSALRSDSVYVTVFAIREKRRWVFANALPVLTQSWKRERVGAIEYVIEPGYAFNRARAESAVAFTDSLAAVFAVPRLAPLTYYLTSTSDEMTRIIGLETRIKWGPSGGLAQPVNHQLFSGMPSIGERYAHELVHIMLRPLVKRTISLADEGVATWLGGTTGMDFPTVAGRLALLLTKSPAIGLDAIMADNVTIPYGTLTLSARYPAGAVLAMMVHERAGVAGIRTLLDAGYGVGEFRQTMEQLFGVPWATIATQWRTRVLLFTSPPATLY